MPGKDGLTHGKDIFYERFMMKRRQILKASAAALLMAPPVLRAQTHAEHGTSMARHHDMMGDAQHGAHADMAEALLPLDRMPSQRPLEALPRLKNASSKAGRFKAKLTAAPAQKTVANRTPTEFWLYNDLLPGPQIEVFEGDEVEILFKNQLPEPTTVHWHGLPVPSDQDGNPQDSVPAGGERTYRFTLPKGSAGTYWYHPHPHGLTAMQVARGLAGTFIVRAKDDPLAELPEQHWMISDLRLDTHTHIPPNTMMDWMNGREGQFVLINGQLRPRITLTTGTRVRIWNNCSSRYLRLAVPGCQWVLLGTDGGLLEQAQAPMDEVFLAPAERVEVMVLTEGNLQGELLNRYYDRAKMMVQEPHTDTVLAHMAVEAKGTPSMPPTLNTLPDLGEPVAFKAIEFSEMEMDHGNHEPMTMSMLQSMFMVDGKVFEMDRIDLRSHVGDVEEWRVFNNSHMDHPFHLHGTQFQVTQREQNGVATPEPFKAWRDTVNLRPYETVVFHVKQLTPGIRMFHCHILEHEDLGMMANLEVI